MHKLLLDFVYWSDYHNSMKYFLYDAVLLHTCCSSKSAMAKMLHTCWSIDKGKVAYYILASYHSSHLNDIASISFLSGEGKTWSSQPWGKLLAFGAIVHYWLDRFHVDSVIEKFLCYYWFSEIWTSCICCKKSRTKLAVLFSFICNGAKQTM